MGNVWDGKGMMHVVAIGQSHAVSHDICVHHFLHYIFCLLIAKLLQKHDSFDMILQIKRQVNLHTSKSSI